MAINNISSVAPKNASQLAGALIPSYSSVALGLAYPGSVASDFPNFSGGYGGTEWRNGIDIGATANGSNNTNVVYAIYSDETSQGYSPSPNVAVGWGITGSTTTDILNTINRLPGMSPVTKHTTYDQAITWLIGQNKYLPVNRDYPGISYNTATPLVAAYDPSFMASYPFTGTAIYDLSGYTGTTGSLQSSTYWDSTNKNAMVFTSSNQDYISFSPISALNFAQGMTISIWFKVTSPAGPVGTLFQINSSASADSSAGPATGIWSRIYVTPSGAIYYDGDPQQQGVGNTITGTKLYNSVSFGAWHNLVLTIDGMNPTGNIKSSLDGAAIVTSDYPFYTVGDFQTGGVTTSYMGCSYNGGGPGAGTFVDGRIGALHIYTGLLTDAQAEDIYAKTNSIYP
jgi:hypothetical protein